MRIGLLVLLVAAVACAPTPAYLDPDRPVDDRVADLIGRMTLEEKVAQLAHEAPAIERLGIPAYDWWNEALHGVARAGRATVFPQAIGLAATWDDAHMLRVATVISDEARAKYHHALANDRHGIYEGLTFFSPNINLFRDPRWGRGMETYGEDPHLTGRLAVQFVRGMQGDDPTYLKTVATAKHFAVHSGPEPDRHSFDAAVSAYDLWDSYLPHFADAVVDGGAESVMCAYNRVYGAPACASTLLLEEILRQEWGFQGYVVSDCWAVSDIHTTHGSAPDQRSASVMALEAGTDLTCGPEFLSLTEAVRQGDVDEGTLDTALTRLYRARFRLGMFDPPDRVPWAAIPYSVNESAEHAAVALETAHKAIVLLKNEGDLLPLPRDLETVAVIGPNADDIDVLLGNYNGIPTSSVTPLAGIRAAVGPDTRVVHVRGADVAPGMPSLVPVPTSALRPPSGGGAGLDAEYFDNPEWAGTPTVTRVDPAPDFHWWEDRPADGVRADSFSVRWQGSLVPPVSGAYAVGVRAVGSARLLVDDSLVVDFSDRHVVQTQWATVNLTSGYAHRVRVEFSDRRTDAVVQLMWAVPEPDLLDRAVAAARDADAVIVFGGLSPRLEGEEMPVSVPGFAGGDRTDLSLPATQEQLLQRVVATGTPVVLVLLNGSALAINWAAEHVPAIVEAWYPGQAAGTAIADVLFGAYNPAGRLPVTFYRSADQLPPFADYAMEGRTYRYFRGAPLFPFGHGLSYTHFAYENLRIPEQVAAGSAADVAVDVVNDGAMEGEEVVQVYVTANDAPGPAPIRTLVGFRRVQLLAGERRSVGFSIPPEDLAIVNTEGRRMVVPGTYTISVGGKQPGFTGVADARTSEVVSGHLTVTGEAVAVRR